MQTSKIFLSSLVMTLSTACGKVNYAPIHVSAIEEPPTEAAAAVPSPAKSVSTTEVVAFGNKQVDFLLVLDDSGSMLPELKKLAARMSTFVSSLEASNIDWQMCMTTTRGTPSAGGAPQYGIPLTWNNYSPTQGTPSYLLKKGTPNLNTVFTSSIDSLIIGGGLSGDERGIKATHDNFLASSTHDCYRKGAAISVIVISDEDERSIGGVPSNVKPGESSGVYQPLEPEDLPQTMIARAQNTFGADVRLIFNSIILKPGDASCEVEQDQSASPSHFGHIYAEASDLTDGGVGSICDADYSSSLNSFKDKIVNSLATLSLQCLPDPKTLTVKVEGWDVSGLKLDGKTLKFTYPMIEGTKIDLMYDCAD